MNQVTEKSIVSRDNYQEIKGMLLAKDEASVNLALTIVEQSDYEESEVYILALLKDCFREVFGSTTKFAEISPNLHDKVKERLATDDVDVTKISFEQIYNLAVKRDVSDEVEFLLEIVRDELVSLMKDFGYKFIDFTELHIKPMGWEKASKKYLADLEGKVNALKQAVDVT